MTSLYGHERGVSMYADQLHAIIQCGGKTFVDRKFRLFQLLEKYERSELVSLSKYKHELKNLNRDVGSKKYGGGIYIKGIKASNTPDLFEKTGGGYRHLPQPYSHGMYHLALLMRFIFLFNGSVDPVAEFGAESLTHLYKMVYIPAVIHYRRLGELLFPPVVIKGSKRMYCFGMLNRKCNDLCQQIPHVIQTADILPAWYSTDAYEWYQYNLRTVGLAHTSRGGGGQSESEQILRYLARSKVSPIKHSKFYHKKKQEIIKQNQKKNTDMNKLFRETKNYLQYACWAYEKSRSSKPSYEYFKNLNYSSSYSSCIDTSVPSTFTFLRSNVDVQQRGAEDKIHLFYKSYGNTYQGEFTDHKMWGSIWNMMGTTLPITNARNQELIKNPCTGSETNGDPVEQIERYMLKNRFLASCPLSNEECNKRSRSSQENEIVDAILDHELDMEASDEDEDTDPSE